MIQKEHKKNILWLILPIIATVIEFFLGIFFYFPVLVGADIRKLLAVVTHLAFIFYPVWLLISLVLHIRSYSQEDYRRIKMLFTSNILYFLALVVLTFLTLMFALYH